MITIIMLILIIMLQVGGVDLDDYICKFVEIHIIYDGQATITFCIVSSKFKKCHIHRSLFFIYLK